MSKHFNGRKFSHGMTSRTRARCGLCGTEMIRFHGVLRCTEVRAGKKKGASARRVIKHGCVKTIAKRARERGSAG